jgi:hypothetical protein
MDVFPAPEGAVKIMTLWRASDILYGLIGEVFLRSKLHKYYLNK